MANEADNLVLLRDLRAGQEDHAAGLERIGARLDGLERELHETRELFTYGLGAIGELRGRQVSQTMRTDDLAAKVDAVIARVEALERRL